MLLQSILPSCSPRRRGTRKNEVMDSPPLMSASGPESGHPANGKFGWKAAICLRTALHLSFNLINPNSARSCVWSCSRVPIIQRT